MRCERSGPPLLLLGVLAASGCGSLDGFRCIGDAQCRRDGRAGVCEAVGYCAYPDPECISGTRYSPDAASAIAEECTEPHFGSDDSGSSGPSPSLDTAGSSTGVPGDGSTSTGPAPFCGDGLVQDGEECDDANDTRADGCNPDCRVSGVLASFFTSDLSESDVAFDLLLWGGDVVIAGYATVEGESTDIFVARYDTAGAAKWTQTWSGGAHGGDRAYALAQGPGGGLFAAGYMIPAAGGNTTPRPQIWIAQLDPDTGDMLWDDRDGDAPPSNDQAWDLLALQDDALVIAGRIGPGSTQDFVVRRYTVAAGALTTDWSYLVQGEADRADWGFALALDGTGRLAIGGATHATTADIDHHFETILLDGNATDPPCVENRSNADTRVAEGNDQIRGLAVAPDGRIAATGFTTKSVADDVDAWVGLYDVGDSCGLAWQKTVPGAAGDRDEGHAVVVDEDGMIVTVGYLRDENTDDLWVSKWTDTGEERWRAELFDGPGNGSDAAWAVTLDEEGEIVVAGYVSKPGGADAWIGRFTP